MAASLPAKLKIPSIVPFANRAAQLEKFRPIISYWCEYYIVNQILTKGLHSADEECKNYTVELMDKLERVKSEGNDAIVDDVAAKAYVEQFALETFQRADDAIHNNKAARSTIDSFQAASTFLELLSVWSPLDTETAAKIKYAKYHALRIAKAIKNGEDPNASNPVQEQPPATPSAEQGLQPSSASYHPPTVETVPNSVQPSRPGSVAQASPFNPPSNTQPDPVVSPIDPMETDNPRQNSVGGGYFPDVPTFTSEAVPPTVPTVNDAVSPALPTAPPMDSLRSPPAMNDTVPSPHDFYHQQPSQPPAAQAPPPTVTNPPPAVTQPPPTMSTSTGGYRTDDESVAAAQKHAKWAMSALNFEDVPTAVKELRIALQSLGGL
ncbi:hypothetical protein MBLNU457_3187t1 [Dothideomycetes sp. NU457]